MKFKDLRMMYNPDDYAPDKCYLEGKNKVYLQQYMANRFKKNKDEMKIQPLKVTKSYINNMSNIYTKPPKYVGVDTLNPDLNIRKYILEMHRAEKFLNMNEVCAMWFYVKNGVMQYKALHPSEYCFFKNSDNENVGIIVISGYKEKARVHEQNLGSSYLPNNPDIQFQSYIVTDYVANFKLFIKNKVYECEADSFNDAMSKDWTEKGTYDVFPFTEFCKNDFPYHSDLIDLENEIVAGDAYSIFTILVSLLKKFVLSGEMEAGEFNELVESFGIPTNLINIPEGGALTVADTGNVQNNIDYKAYMNNNLKFVGKGDGVDENGLFPDTKVQSGIAKRLDITNIIPVRDEKITEIYIFEQENWAKINEFIKVGMPEDIIFAKINFIDPVEEIEIFNKRIDAFVKLIDKGLVPEVVALSKILDVAEDEAQEMLSKAKENRSDELVGLKQILQEQRQIIQNQQDIDMEEDQDNE